MFASNSSGYKIFCLAANLKTLMIITFIHNSLNNFDKKYMLQMFMKSVVLILLNQVNQGAKYLATYPVYAYSTSKSNAETWISTIGVPGHRPFKSDLDSFLSARNRFRNHFPSKHI